MIWNKKKRVEKKWSWGLAATFAVTMVLNGLAGSTTVLGGVNTAQVSDSFPNLFAPAGVTFAIWGVIYLLVAGFILYVFGIGRSKKSTLTIDALTDVTKLLTVNLALNSVWILAWQYKILWLSVLLMITLLVTLIKMADLLRSQKVRGGEYAQTKLPVSVYFGWITVATVANITIFLVAKQVPWSSLVAIEVPPHYLFAVFLIVMRTSESFMSMIRLRDYHRRGGGIRVVSVSTLSLASF